jgi:6-phosphogluconolactonase/glucosamine-6-phosphate isomerase/deaminase
MADVTVYPDADAAAVGLGDYTAAVAAASIKAHGAFTVAIAGGSLVKVGSAPTAQTAPFKVPPRDLQVAPC